jgi:hypothetical protein
MAHHGDCAAATVERSLMGLGVDPACESAYDRIALSRKFQSEAPRHPATRVAGRTDANHGDELRIVGGNRPAD